MCAFKIPALVGLLFALLCLTNNSKAQSVTGMVKDVSRNRPISFAVITLLSDKGRHVEVTNDQGKFEFRDMPPGNYTVSMDAMGYRDTTFMRFFLSADTSLNLVYSRNCPYDRSIKNKTCPQCRKKRHVIPIIYGLPVSLNGKDPMDGNGVKFLLAGCEVTDCDPNWYCRRDKLSF